MKILIELSHAFTPTQTDFIDLVCVAIATTETPTEEDVEDTAIAVAVMAQEATVLQRFATSCCLRNIVIKEVNMMNLRGLPLGLLGFLSVPAMLCGLPGSIAPASAQCVMTDVGVQVAIRGSKHPANQQNNVDMQNPGRCNGNAITQTGTQVYAGSADQVNQIRNSHQSAGGSDGQGPGGPVIRVPVGVKVDVYNPAYDPAFMNRLGR